jgi:folate-binding protein YgfZ|tara:strand:- start:6372 stop:7244 length:873 start_codon:yes stop_codon:yes gene_type:complete
MNINSIHERFYKKKVYYIKGKDYIKFFNNITTNKIVEREDNVLLRTLWLNNKGRIVHDLSIGWYRNDSANDNDKRIFLIDNFSVESIEENINKYKMSLNIKIEKTELEARIVDKISTKVSGIYFFKTSIPLMEKYIAIGNKKNIEQSGLNIFDRKDFINNGSIYNKMIQNNKTPMELNLWYPIDFKKGCYLGQEIVARVRYKGQVKRNFSYVAVKSTKSMDDQKIYKGIDEIGKLINLELIEDGISYYSALINHNENYEQKGLLVIVGKKEYSANIIKNNFKEYNEKGLG